MHLPKSILLLGATGRTGKEVLDIALSRKYLVHALLRDRDKIIPFRNQNLKVLQGDTRDPADISKTMKGVGAFISCLNISRKSDFPWSDLRTPPSFLSETMKDIIDGAKQSGVNRLIFTSAWCVAESRPFIPSWFAWLIDNSNISAAYLEHEWQEALVKASNMDWTIVRPVGLIDSSCGRPTRVFLQNEAKPSLTISRRNTALFLLDTLEQRRYIRQIPVISH